MGIPDLLDNLISEALGVDVETYIKVVEDKSMSQKTQEDIIMPIMSKVMGMTLYSEEDYENSIKLFKDALNGTS